MADYRIENVTYEQPHQVGILSRCEIRCQTWLQKHRLERQFLYLPLFPHFPAETVSFRKALRVKGQESRVESQESRVESQESRVKRMVGA